jgi:hypothetical protein
LEEFLIEYKPHDYQQFAINYILEHLIAAVILKMDLGKTSITLTAIEQLIYDSFEVSRVLVVAPLRVARNTWSAGSGGENPSQASIESRRHT